MNSCTAVFFVCAALITVGSASVVFHPRQKQRGNLEYVSKTQKKQLYITKSSEDFEVASNNCESIGGKLATITTSEDLEAIQNATAGQIKCWEWENLPIPAPEYYVQWNAEAHNRIQIQQLSKGYFDVQLGNLGFDVNISSRPFACEISLH